MSIIHRGTILNHPGTKARNGMFVIVAVHGRGRDVYDQSFNSSDNTSAYPFVNIARLDIN